MRFVVKVTLVTSSYNYY